MEGQQPGLKPTTPPRIERVHLYQKVWRWHFYAGLFLVPIMTIFAVTGLMILYDGYIKQLRYPELMLVESDGRKPVSLDTQIAAISKAMPGYTVERAYLYPNSANKSRMFNVRNKQKDRRVVYVNPYTGKVLGSEARGDTLMSISVGLHRRLLLGDFGRTVIEISAGLGFILIISGLYLWWPGGNRRHSGLWLPRARYGLKNFIKEFHITSGVWMSAGLAFFLLTGMTMTAIWGKKILKPNDYYPKEKSRRAVTSNLPGTLEDKVARLKARIDRTSVTSTPAAENWFTANNKKVTPTTVEQFIRQDGVKDGYRLYLPSGKKGVYSVSVESKQGAIFDPRDDRTIHIDQYSGEKLADINFNDFSTMGQAISVGKAIHFGRAGLWNVIVNTIFCLFLVAISITGAIMWWQRRPAKAGMRLSPPAKGKNARNFWPAVTAVLVVVGVIFPPLGATLIAVYLLDTLILSRIPILERFFYT